MVGLCSKTYYGWGEDGNKSSCKGISKQHTDLSRERYLSVLQEQSNQTGVNMGSKLKDNVMYSYCQTKDALTYLYPKRKVLADGVTTCLLYTSDAADD